MKKMILILALPMFMLGPILANAQSTDRKPEKAGNRMQEANQNAGVQEQNSNKLRQNDDPDYKKFRKESEERINKNNDKIAELKAKIANEKNEDKAKYEKKLAKFEEKNAEMKMKLEDYKYEGKGKWEIFKKDFSHSMDELGNSFKKFFDEK